MNPRSRLALWSVILGAVLYLSGRRIGPLPALGPFLDPANGVWSLSRTADLPESSVATIGGLGGEVTIIYDDRAVPHIFAATENDAYRALGYVVARDRLFQMHLQTVAAAGRLTEIAGSRALPLDREMRGLGLAWTARQNAAKSAGGAEFTEVVNAYAEGVNAWIADMSPSELPLEFRLTGSRPAQWSATSSYLLLGRMGWTLAWLDTESDRYAAAALVGANAAAALFSSELPIQEPIQPSRRGAPRLDLEKLPPPGAPDNTARIFASARESFRSSRAAESIDGESSIFASNNWAVSPARSATGHALLAGDPHLDMTLPSIWYEAHIVVPGKLDVYGVTIPGAPFIVIGLNRDVAWTMTNTGLDVLDFYIEQVDDTLRPTRHLVDSTWRDVTSRVEVYSDGSGATVATDTLYFTYRGPLRKINGRWISLRWTVLESGGEPNAFFAAQRSTSAAELQAAVGEWYRAPAQNFLAADRDGHIAIRSTGRFPIRAGDGAGDVVRDGSTSASDWRGDVPLAGYPQAFDPAQGFVASANQQPIDPGTSPYWWGGSFDPWRALRINELLRGDSSVTVDDMRSWQTDPGSVRAATFVPRILAGARNALRSNAPFNGREKVERAAMLLAEWDLRYTRDNNGAVLFEETLTEIVNRTWDELLPTDTSTRRVATPPSAVLVKLMADSASVWWDDRRTVERETRDGIIAAALARALDRVISRHGDPAGDGWRWDKVRFANINHLLRLPSLSMFNVAVQGGPGTLSPASGTGTHGASWRMVVELGPEVKAWSTYPGGQSGNPISSRYSDRIAKWSRGELDEIRFPRAAADLTDGQRLSSLTLRPRR